MGSLKDIPTINAQVSAYISEGNPNTQEGSLATKGVWGDQQSMAVVQQAIKDDESLSLVARDIHVAVKDGAITLDGKVTTEQQINLVTNIATAFVEVNKVNNHMTLNKKRFKIN